MNVSSNVAIRNLNNLKMTARYFPGAERLSNNTFPSHRWILALEMLILPCWTPAWLAHFWQTLDEGEGSCLGAEPERNSITILNGLRTGLENANPTMLYS